ncbi:MAG: dephospho-CoA kinase [Oscillospiraceae bacterium]|nr:dephospho-CoA kinase [Oscillospiraceae bacterium]
MILGITGGSGSGKTTLLQLVEASGGVILDCDAIYHQLLQNDKQLLQTIENRFPGTVIDGVLARKKLGEVVFADEAALQELNQITHSAVKKEVLRILESKPTLAAIDAIGLFESGLDALCDATVAVTAPEAMRIRRLMARDGISYEYAQKRIRAQHPDQWYAGKCTYTLENDGCPDGFRVKCIAFLRHLGIMKAE